MIPFALIVFGLIALPNSAAMHEPNKTAIFIHGAGGGGWEWNSWVPAFKKAGWVCIARDLVPAKAGIAETKFDDYVAQIEQMAGQHKGDRIVLIGASMGGIIALKASESIGPAAVVLVNSVGPKGIQPGKPKTWPKVVEWSKGSLKETQDSMPDSDEATIQFAFRHWRDESGSVLSEISSGIAVNAPQCPVLVALGEQDTDVPNLVGIEMARQYGANLHIFKGMSHVGPLLGTKAPKVAAWVLNWLDEHVR